MIFLALSIPALFTMIIDSMDGPAFRSFGPPMIFIGFAWFAALLLIAGRFRKLSVREEKSK